MPPIQLSRAERKSLQRISDGYCQPGDIPADHEEKFLNYGLAHKHVLMLSITALGQCELLRHRFGGLAFPQLPASVPDPLRLLGSGQDL